jgi:hypothetical protein
VDSKNWERRPQEDRKDRGSDRAWAETRTARIREAVNREEQPRTRGKEAGVPQKEWWLGVSQMARIISPDRAVIFPFAMIVLKCKMIPPAPPHLPVRPG